MKKKDCKNLEIKHKRGILTDSEGIKSIDYMYSYYTTSHTKRYHNCLKLLFNLTPCARNLLDYLTDIMGPDNMVCSNKGHNESFIRLSNNTYGESSIRKAYRELTEARLLIHWGRGSYRVNPEYFFKNDDSHRDIKIKMVLDFEFNRETKLYVKFDKPDVYEKDAVIL